MKPTSRMWQDVRPGDYWLERKEKVTVITVSVDGDWVNIKYAKGGNLGDVRMAAMSTYDIYRPEPEVTKEELDEAKQGLESWLQ